MLLEGKAVLVVGGSPSLARAIALEVIHQGGDIALVGNGLPDTSGLVSTTNHLGKRSFILDTTAEHDKSVRQVVSQAATALGALHVLVNCAGRDAASRSVEEITDEAWALTMAENVRQPLVFVREVMPFFHENGGGAIVNVASISAKFKPGPVSAAYAAAMSAMCALTRNLASDLESLRIRVNAVLPAPSVLESARESHEPLANGHNVNPSIAARPGDRLDGAEDVARVVAWLASDYNSAITGETIAPGSPRQIG